MNDRVKIIRDGREHDVPLPDGIDFDLDRMQARIVGRTIVLEQMPQAGAIPPGSYTSQTLPPLSAKARAILASVDAAAARTGAAKADDADGALEIEDAEVAIELTDEPLPGIDPDR